jgi:hypothetical protein
MRHIPIKKIEIAKYNPRKDLKPGDFEYDSIKRSIITHGYVDPMVWNEYNNVLIGGHQRLKILQELGQTKVDVSVVNIKDERAEMEMNVDLNQSRGEYDPAKLWEMQQYYQKKGWSDFGKGFRAGELDEICKKIGEEGLESFDEKPEIKFTEELMEEHNYVVLYFKNKVDWLWLNSLYELKTVKALDSKEGYEKMGVGRVVDGVTFLNHIVDQKKNENAN